MEITEEELQELLNKANKEGAMTVLKELQQTKVHKDKDAYKDSERILRGYNTYKRAIAMREEKIKDIEKYGIQKKSCSITSYPGGTRSITDDSEKADEQIAALKKQNEITKGFIARVDEVLTELQDDPYYQLIPMYYFEGKKYDVIAGELGIGISTVSVNKSRLVNIFKTLMFPDASIAEYGI